jgi:glucokinase
VTAPPVAAAAIGLDLGGTKVLGVRLDAQGAVQRDVRRPTPDGAEAIVDVLAAVATELGRPAAGETSDGDVPIGVGAPGLITLDGVLVSSPNLPGVTDLHLGEELTGRLGAPVAVSNDATCAALAEWRVGAGRGVDDLVMVTLGTGIGGGVVAGGRVLTGAHGFTGEFGHMVVAPDGLPCPCGRRGCWERYASGSGLATLAQRAAGEGRLDRVLALAGGTPGDVRGEHVHRAATEGDAGALGVVDEFARWVALGLANLTNALDPAAFILGGGLAEGAALFLGPIRRWYQELLYAGDRRPLPALAFAELGEHAGAIGAALFALDRTAS